jgi:triphosphoribosyl-dephospho-CoA synthetase
MPADERIEALNGLDRELISRKLSPGGSADMLALAFLLDRWHVLSADIFIDGREDR